MERCGYRPITIICYRTCEPGATYSVIGPKDFFRFPLQRLRFYPTIRLKGETEMLTIIGCAVMMVVFGCAAVYYHACL